MLRHAKLLSVLTLFICNISAATEVKSFPILKAIEENGGTLSKSTKKWMKRWKGMELDDSSLFSFKEISGTTSINLKIQKIDAEEEKGYKSYGSFVATNEAANPNAEIAYFNLAAIVGADSFFRPTIRYEMGNPAKLEFKKLLSSVSVKGSMRSANKERILKALSKPELLPGCVKAKKEDFSVAIEDMVTTGFRGRVSLKSSHSIIKFIQADNAQPKKGDTVTLRKDYTGDALELSREFSILLTLDVVFGQYDRFSGGNIVIMKDENQIAHFYATDNGGAYIVDSLPNSKKTASFFSRFDKKAILKIKEMNNFLINPSVGFMGYTDAEAFVVDMGLYFDMSPARYVQALKNNIAVLLLKVKESETRFGDKAYFEDL